MLFSDLLITPAEEMTSWQNIFVAIVPVLGVIAVAYLQFVYKAGKKRGQDAMEANEMFMNQWTQNKEDHATVVRMIEQVGKSLGKSIDRNNKSLDRVEEKLDSHITDHIRGDL